MGDIGRRSTQEQRSPHMKFYTKQHNFYCGIDLHADAMYVCDLNSVCDSGGS